MANFEAFGHNKKLIAKLFFLKIVLIDALLT